MGSSGPADFDDWLLERAGLIPPGVAQRARMYARLRDGATVSGQRLAEELGVSRAAVHKHAEGLRGLGVAVRSAPGTGYRLDEAADLLAPEVLLPLLAGADTGLGLPVVYRPTVDSTNMVAREEARGGAPHGTLVTTDHQDAGKGRLGREWVSEAGKDLTFSVLLRPRTAPESAPRFTIAASTAVADALESLDGLVGRVGIKWPNDVLVDGRKVCGILSEASLDMDRLHWLVVGIGLNLNGSPGARVPAAARTAGAPLPASVRELLGKPVMRPPFLVGLLERLEARWDQCQGDAWSEVLARFGELDALSGKTVRVVAIDRPDAAPLVGTARGLSEAGQLLVEDGAGAVRTVLSGDVTLSAMTPPS